jgi:integrase
MSKNLPGLQYDKATDAWSIDKRIKGHGRIRQRLTAKTPEEAEKQFFQTIAQIQGEVHRREEGIMTFQEATDRYLDETQKRSIDRDRDSLRFVAPYIGELPLANVHMGTLQRFINDRRKAGIASSTVKRDLSIVRRVLTLAARSWRNDNGQPYLSCPPLFEMPDWEDAANPYPLDFEEMERLLKALPPHLRAMSIFAANTGLREQGVCWLRWDWEVAVPELGTTIFITPGRKRVYADGEWPGEKNKEDQLVVLNSVTKAIIEVQRKNRQAGCPYVFPYRGKRVTRLHNSAWKKAWRAAGLPVCDEYTRGPHNLKHTFGHRLRVAGVPLETRKKLLHHSNGDITTHYSPAGVAELLEAVEKIVNLKPVSILRRVI